MKVKLFGKAAVRVKKEPSRCGLEVLDLEKEINAWLEQNPSVKIIDVKQSSNGGSFGNTKLFLSVWYEENA